jgi:hypothetical protein
METKDGNASFVKQKPMNLKIMSATSDLVNSNNYFYIQIYWPKVHQGPSRSIKVHQGPPKVHQGPC